MKFRRAIIVSLAEYVLKMKGTMLPVFVDNFQLDFSKDEDENEKNEDLIKNEEQSKKSKPSLTLQFPYEYP